MWFVCLLGLQGAATTEVMVGTLVKVSCNGDRPNHTLLSASSWGQSKAACLTVRLEPHLGHWGLTSLQNKYPWVANLCTVRSLQRTTSSCLALCEEESQWNRFGLIAYGFYHGTDPMFLAIGCAKRNQLLGKVPGRQRKPTGQGFPATHLGASATSLPVTPTWLGIQQCDLLASPLQCCKTL